MKTCTHIDPRSIWNTERHQSVALGSGIHVGMYEIVTGSRIMHILVLITMQQLQSKI